MFTMPPEDKEDPVAQQFVALVRLELLRQDLSIKDLADRVGVSRQAVSEVLNKATPIRSSTMTQWADALGFTIELKRIIKREHHASG